MPDTTTEYLELVKPEAGSAGWHTKWDANLDEIDKFLAQSGTKDPNAGSPDGVVGVYVGQPYYKTDSEKFYICTTPGDMDDVVWTILPEWLIEYAAANVSSTWEKGQKAIWEYYEAGAEIYYPDIAVANYHWVKSTGATVIGPPTNAGDDYGAATLVLAFEQGGSGTLSWDSVFKFSVDVEFPYTTVNGEVDIFSCIRAPNGLWMVSGSIKYDIY